MAARHSRSFFALAGCLLVIVAGTLALAWYCRHRGARFFTWADFIVAAAPIGQAIGRWGNWANQELFGRPSTLPWAVEIGRAHV